MSNHDGVNSGGSIVGVKIVHESVFCVGLKLLFFCLFYRFFVRFFNYSFSINFGCSFPRFCDFIKVH